MKRSIRQVKAEAGRRRGLSNSKNNDKEKVIKTSLFPLRTVSVPEKIRFEFVTKLLFFGGLSLDVLSYFSDDINDSS